MVDVDEAIEKIRLSFQSGNNQKPHHSLNIPSPEFNAHVEAIDVLIGRGLMDIHFNLTEVGRVWASE